MCSQATNNDVSRFDDSLSSVSAEDRDYDNDSDADNEYGDNAEDSNSCQWTCSKHYISAGGTIMEGTCLTDGYKCCQPGNATDTDFAEPQNSEDISEETSTDTSLQTFAAKFVGNITTGRQQSIDMNGLKLADYWDRTCLECTFNNVNKKRFSVD